MQVLDRVVGHQQAVVPFKILTASAATYLFDHFLVQGEVVWVDASTDQFQRHGNADLKFVEAIKLFRPCNLSGCRLPGEAAGQTKALAFDKKCLTAAQALFSRKETATETLDLNEATREVIALSLSEFQRNQIVSQAELAEHLPLVMGDRVQLQQVILNLLRNAADAMSTIDDRPRELLVRTERAEGNQVQLSVKDTGGGFAPEAADKIFEGFYTTKTDGMGIGLSISRSIIETHHGRLWATKNDGPGSTFSFAIPCALDACG